MSKVTLIDNVIEDLDKIKLQLKKLKIETESKTSDEALYKEFFFDNFELTNDKKDYVCCKDLTKFFIIHFPLKLTAKSLEMLSSLIVKSSSIKINNKTFKVKLGVKPKKSLSEFISS